MKVKDNLDGTSSKSPEAAAAESSNNLASSDDEHDEHPRPDDKYQRPEVRQSTFGGLRPRSGSEDSSSRMHQLEWENVLEISSLRHGRSYYLKADTSEKCDEWICAILDAQKDVQLSNGLLCSDML